MLRQAQTGIILATSVMYLRLLIVVAVFDRQLAVRLAPPLLILAVIGLVLAGLCYWISASPNAGRRESARVPVNPLELIAAFIFAALFIAISLASGWVRCQFGEGALFALAAIIGLTDIDPFVLSVAAGGSQFLPDGGAVAAILIAASSNNLIKAAYTAGCAGARAAAIPATAGSWPFGARRRSGSMVDRNRRGQLVILIRRPRHCHLLFFSYIRLLQRSKISNAISTTPITNPSSPSLICLKNLMRAMSLGCSKYVTVLRQRDFNRQREADGIQCKMLTLRNSGS